MNALQRFLFLTDWDVVRERFWLTIMWVIAIAVVTVMVIY